MPRTLERRLEIVEEAAHVGKARVFYRLVDGSLAAGNAATHEATLAQAEEPDVINVVVSDGAMPREFDREYGVTIIDVTNPYPPPEPTQPAPASEAIAEGAAPPTPLAAVGAAGVMGARAASEKRRSRPGVGAVHPPRRWRARSGGGRRGRARDPAPRRARRRVLVHPEKHEATAAKRAELVGQASLSIKERTPAEALRLALQHEIDCGRIRGPA